MYSSPCIRPREEVQHRSGHVFESCIRPLVFVRVKKCNTEGIEPCVRPREEVQARSGHGLRGVESCIRPR